VLNTREKLLRKNSPS